MSAPVLTAHDDPEPEVLAAARSFIGEAVAAAAEPPLPCADDLAPCIKEAVEAFVAAAFEADLEFNVMVDMARRILGPIAHAAGHHNPAPAPVLAEAGN